MATSENNRQTWTILKSKEAVNQNDDKLIVLIFNKSAVPRFDPELTLTHKRQQYEDSNKVKFFKYNVKDIDAALPTEFKVTDVPTYIFYRNGEECGRLQGPKEEILFAEINKLIK